MAISSLPFHTASLFLFLSSLALHALTRTTANEGNVLLTGDTLTTDSQLSYLDNTFVMQDDCNLVLYNKGNGYQSDTHGKGLNCTLTLDYHGRLLIKSANGSTVWTSKPAANTKIGKYAAILRPDGQVAVYGPVVWSTPRFGLALKEADAYGSSSANIPTVTNVLFSSQILNANSELTSRDYTFTVNDDCNLVLVKASEGAVWQSRTAGKGHHCFLRLDHRGQLAVMDDGYKTLWSSKPATLAKDGDYVLIMQINGQAVVYGPAVWSSASSH